MGFWEGLLTTFKYVGLLVTAFSSYWGIVHNVTAPDAAGVKRLTRAGFVAIIAVIFGLVLNIASEFLQERIQSAKAQKRIAVERYRALHLASASQPLQSLRLTWWFSGVANDHVKQLAQNEKEVHDIQENDDDHKVLSLSDYGTWVDNLRSAYVGYPWWAMMASGTWSRHPPVIIRIPLYQSEAVVLPIGALPLADANSTNERDKQLRNVAAAIVAYEDADYDPADGPPSDGRRTRPPGVLTSVNVENGKIEFDAEIEATVLPRAIDRKTAELTPLTLLPEKMDVLVLSSFGALLPWPYDNFSGRLQRLELRPDNPSRIPFSNCGLRIIPNDVADLAAEYKFISFERGKILEPAGPESTQDPYCDYVLLKLERVYPADS